MKLRLDRPNLILDSFDTMIHRQIEEHLTEEHKQYVERLQSQAEEELDELKLYSLADHVLGDIDA